MRDPILDPILVDPIGSNQSWEDACKLVLQNDFGIWQALYEVDLETGNPIYAIYEPLSNKAIRIIQNERDSQYGFYMRKGGPDDLVDEVVFTCALNEATISVFKLVFRIWTRSQTDANYMKDLIARSSLWNISQPI
jgi:hypothetical protein